MKAARSLTDYFNAWHAARMAIDVEKAKRPRTILRAQPLLTLKQYIREIKSRDDSEGLVKRLNSDRKRFSKRVKRLNALVRLARATLSRKAFRRYLDEAYLLLYGELPHEKVVRPAVT